MSKPKLAVQVVEIEKPFVVPQMDAGAAAAVASLNGHPGWQWLIHQLRYQSALLTAALIKTRHKSKEDFEFLQSGINWCGWLEEQMSKATGMLQRKDEPREMRPLERESFEKLLSQIDVIGVTQPADNS